MRFEGKWALITGASAGIGTCFARKLAAEGAHLALTARRKDRLDALAAELGSQYGAQTLTIAADLADPTAPDSIFAALKTAGATCDVLVNNAGYGVPGNFGSVPWADHRAFIEVMVTSYVRLAYLALPRMQARGYGRMINVASVAGLVPGSAGHTLYGASKAFIVSFSQSLAAECERSDIRVSALCPGFTHSEFHDVTQTRDLVSKLPKYMFMAPEPVVEGALAAVEGAHVVYVPGAWNKFVVWLAKALPRPWAADMVKRQSARFRHQAEG